MQWSCLEKCYGLVLCGSTVMLEVCYMLCGFVVGGLVLCGACMLGSSCGSHSSSMLCVDSRHACCKTLDNDLALADIGKLKGPLVSVVPEAGIEQVHTPTQVAHC